MVYQGEIMLNKVIVISTHPDDETLGAGGTILKYKHLGYKVYWLNITNIKNEFKFKKSAIKKRDIELNKVLKEYKFDDFFDLGLKPAGLDEYPKKTIIKKISEVFTKIQPNTVILPYKNDIHSDHRVVFESAFACTKIFNHPQIRKILMMEVISETNFSLYWENFLPNYFVDISDYLEKKIRIMKIYEGEFKNHPFPRSTKSIEALATIRGSLAGCKYAEGFFILKAIE